MWRNVGRLAVGLLKRGDQSATLLIFCVLLALAWMVASLVGGRWLEALISGGIGVLLLIGSLIAQRDDEASGYVDRWKRRKDDLR